MTTLSWTVPLVSTDGTPTPHLDLATIWEGMRNKVENPTPYVPYIVGCEIIERYPDGLLRKIAYDYRGEVVERVTYEPMTRMVFRPVDDPEVSEIINEVSVDGDGFVFTLKVTLSEAAQRNADRDAEYVKEMSDIFSSSLETIVAATLEHARAQARS